jgi:hypothetical protein
MTDIITKKRKQHSDAQDSDQLQSDALNNSDAQIPKKKAKSILKNKVTQSEDHLDNNNDNKYDDDKKGPTPKKSQKRKRKTKGMKKRMQKNKKEGESSDGKSSKEKDGEEDGVKKMEARVLNRMYLSEWSTNRLEWKFQKSRQNWLIK